MEDKEVVNESPNLGQKPVRQARRKPRPLFGDPAALESQKEAVRLAVDLEVLNQKAIESGMARAALLRSGVSEKEISEAQKIKFYIWNEGPEAMGGEAILTPYMPTVMTRYNPETGMPRDLPRGEAMFLYQPSFEVTSDNKHEHEEMCRQRINTTRIAHSQGEPEAFGNQRNRPVQSRAAFTTNAGEL